MKAQPLETKPAVKPQGKPTYGRAVMVEGVGKELYRVSVLELENGNIVKRTVVEEGRGQEGASLPVAFAAVGVNVSKHLREVSDLWQRSQR